MGLVHVKARRFSVEEYMRLWEQGVLPQDERTELLEGEIIPRMTQNPPHGWGIILGTRVLMKALGDTHHVAVQVTVRLTPWSAPEPDFILVALSHRIGQPLTSGELIVEVADTSLALDRHEKASLYALAAIPEYWIVNLIDRQLEIHRDPEIAAGTPYGAVYRTATCHAAGTRVAPLCRPDVSVFVSDLLPPAETISEQP